MKKNTRAEIRIAKNRAIRAAAKRKAVLKECLSRMSPYLIVLCIYGIPLMTMRQDVLRTSEVLVGQKVWNITVLANHSIRVRDDIHMSTTLFARNGKVIVEHVFGAARRWPIRYEVSPSPDEIALYQKYFTL